MNCNYGSLFGQTWPAQAPIGSLLSVLKNCDVLLTINGLILEYIKHMGTQKLAMGSEIEDDAKVTRNGGKRTPTEDGDTEGLEVSRLDTKSVTVNK